MSQRISKSIVEKALPLLKCWKDVHCFKISEGVDSEIILFNGNSANLETNKVLSVQGEETSLADAKKEGKAISQKFSMNWIATEDGKEIEFNGLTGGLSGQSGRPGVKFNSSNNSIDVNLLLCRSEGSFAIHSTNGEKFFMIVVAPNEQNGPDHNRISVIPLTTGIKLESGWWHSVPFPHPQGNILELEEFVVENVENEAIELSKEVEKTLQLTL